MPKSTLGNGIKTGFVAVGIIITLVTTVFLGGTRIGRTEQAVAEASREREAISARQKVQEEMLATVRAEQAYQKGVVNTKLDNLQASVEQIKKIISEWEPQ